MVEILLFLVPVWMLFLVWMALRTISYLHYDNLQIDAEPELLERLRAFSAETGMELKSPSYGPNSRLEAQSLNISGLFQGYPATWSLQIASENGNLMMQEMRMVLHPEHKLGFDLHVEPKPAPKSRARFKTKVHSDLLTGDHEFDAHFNVKTDSPERVSGFLTGGVRKGLMDLEAEPDSTLKLTDSTFQFSKKLHTRLISENFDATFDAISILMRDVTALTKAFHDALADMEEQKFEIEPAFRDEVDVVYHDVVVGESSLGG